MSKIKSDMSVRERFAVTIPSEYGERMNVSRVAPNEGHFPVDAEAIVRTESGHNMTFRSRQIGRSATYLLVLVSSEPPITVHPVADKEVWVDGGRISIDDTFTLASAFPVFKDGQDQFVAKEIEANIDVISFDIED